MGWVEREKHVPGLAWPNRQLNCDHYQGIGVIS